jgi:hypothetical protein
MNRRRCRVRGCSYRFLPSAVGSRWRVVVLPEEARSSSGLSVVANMRRLIKNVTILITIADASPINSGRVVA